MNPSTPPKGSLEELFRHHLLESEAAAVRPRPQVWEQVDNSLLLAQNEKYRRRLLAYRWAMAASLLLASLAGGGWWRSQHNAALAPSLAQATTQPSRPNQLTGPITPFSTATPTAIDQTATLTAAAASASSSTSSIGIAALASGQLPRPAARYATQTAGQLYGQVPGRRRPASVRMPAGTAGQPAGQVAGTLSAAAGTLVARAGLATATLSNAAQTADQLTVAQVAAPVEGASQEFASAPATTTAEASLAARWASLAAPTAVALPAHLSEVAVAPGPPLELARRWQYGLTYAASAYQPNIDWTKSATAYNTALGFNSASLTRSAAAEYRDNLRPGLGQRLSLWATRRLGNGRWSLRTGLEIAQNTATSASSVAFVGEQVADVSYTQAGLAYAPSNTVRRLQRTSYRYRSVSVPAELRYSNSLKTGFSFYGRVGAFVSALLNVHSEVEGSPEAARTYTMQSASTPYRPFSGGLRGAAGIQYRPAGHQWSLNFGPVTELGILSLNTDPSQNFWGQQRPYSFGLEAGMELGRGFKLQ
ncbi:hypothetical protein GKZ68_14925 [Hymenobacter sp. BRD128]|uniref:outer membrane beta-barrel protein n=1 Tax=Hymenobacter sp. BRD128 TaxID=2675878 RepID=UPI001566CBA0|nr:outer membrane beta-barrel protein [Hymenobacter sp. BRD128]QKG57803.1 hypothetical protein GKZ68_14925 [Hymenobacter sp. BRD128]